MKIIALSDDAAARVKKIIEQERDTKVIGIEYADEHDVGNRLSDDERQEIVYDIAACTEFIYKLEKAR